MLDWPGSAEVRERPKGGHHAPRDRCQRQAAAAKAGEPASY
jgi:hypothetical protein